MAKPRPDRYIIKKGETDKFLNAYGESELSLFDLLEAKCMVAALEKRTNNKFQIYELVPVRRKAKNDKTTKQ